MSVHAIVASVIVVALLVLIGAAVVSIVRGAGLVDLGEARCEQCGLVEDDPLANHDVRTYQRGRAWPHRFQGAP